MNTINRALFFICPLVLSSLLAVINVGAQEILVPTLPGPDKQQLQRVSQSEDTQEIETLSVWEKSELGPDWEAGLCAYDTLAETYCDRFTRNLISWAEFLVRDPNIRNYIRVEFGNTGADGVFYIGSDAGVDLSDYAESGELVFDIRLPQETVDRGMFYKLDCFFPCTSGDIALDLTDYEANTWMTVRQPLADLVAQGLNPSNVNTGIVLFPTWGNQADTYFDFANIRFEKPVGSSAGNDTVVGPANFSGVFGDAVALGGDEYSVPASAQPWAGFANLNSSMYPLTFPEGGTITFTGQVIDPADATADVYFVFENAPYPDIDPYFATERVTLTGAAAQYEVAIPAQAVGQTFESFLLYVVERDTRVLIQNVMVTGPGITPDEGGGNPGDGTIDSGDDDNDGVINSDDAFPNDPAAAADMDEDGKPDAWLASASAEVIAQSSLRLDLDIDGDGVANVNDAFPLVALNGLLDTDNDGAPDACGVECTDLGMAADTDDDGDGIPDDQDNAPTVGSNGLIKQLVVLKDAVVGEPWTTGLIGISDDAPYVTCFDDFGAGCANIDWLFEEDAERGLVVQVAHNANKSTGYAFLEVARSKQDRNQRLDLREYEAGSLRFDIKVLESGDNRDGFTVGVNCYYPCQGLVNTGPVGLDGWQTVEIPLFDFVLSGLDLSSVNLGISISPVLSQIDGVVYQIDNVVWELRESDDAFPNDPAAWQDTDGDGAPDAWALAATPEQIDASSLILDEDDDNDGVPDTSDYWSRDPSRSGTVIADALAGVVDANLRACVEELYPRVTFAEQIEYVVNCPEKIASLEGIAVFSQLKHLVISNEFSRLDELANLPSLEYLFLTNGAPIETLEPLRGKDTLISLGLDFATVDVSVLQSLERLVSLALAYSDLPAVPDLSMLPSLTQLVLYKTNTSNIDELAKLSRLKRLAITEGGITSITPLASIESLETLTLKGHEISDIAPIEGHTEILHLDLSDNNIDSLAALEGMTRLSSAKLNRNPLSEQEIQRVPSAALETLDIGFTEITSVAFLPDFIKLETLNIDGNRITDYLPLSDLGFLKRLEASQMNPAIESLGELPNIGNLQDLWVASNRIKVLTDSNNPQLEALYLINNPYSCEEEASFRESNPNITLLVDDTPCIDYTVDRDGDRIQDDEDAFPDDPAAAIDTDLDGMPDDWLADALPAVIDQSALVLDTDDDGDGASDLDEISAGTDPLNDDDVSTATHSIIWLVPFIQR